MYFYKSLNVKCVSKEVWLNVIRAINHLCFIRGPRTTKFITILFQLLTATHNFDTRLIDSNKNQITTTIYWYFPLYCTIIMT